MPPRRETTGRRTGPSFDDSLLKELDPPGKSLKVTSVNVFLEENKSNHWTAFYENSSLILRRGYEFKVAVAFDRTIDKDDDVIVLQFATGKQPRESKGTVVRIKLSLDGKEKSYDVNKAWSASDINVGGSTIELKIRSPPDICVGYYNIFIETKKGKEETRRYLYHDERVIFLFNPLNEEDEVYVPKFDDLVAYAFFESGGIPFSKDRFRKWNYGQFQRPCLDVALKLFDMYELSDVGRSKAVSVLRCISATSNSQDEGGVLVGNWSDKPLPEGTTKPGDWTGSVKILDQFHQTEKSVKYGQCWVFSGIVTTLCRALGIPTRSVTNISSAHDHDENMTIDKYYDEEGEFNDWMSDSIWNFHVWNEAWLQRHDLPDGYGGWQAFDGTPQEASDGVMRCGPASVRAVKEGKVYLNYDVGFVYAEVNGDEVKWTIKADGSDEIIGISDNVVGENVLTVPWDRIVDITNTYKYPEGSQEEREVAKFIERFSPGKKRNIYKDKIPKEIDIEFNLPEETIIGHDFEVVARVKNTTEAERKVGIIMTLWHSQYFGTPGIKILTEKQKKTLKAKEETRVVMKIPQSKYLEQMNPEGRFRVIVAGRNMETNRQLDKSVMFELKNPELILEASENAPVGKDTPVQIKFTNTTTLTLKNVKLSIDGPGLLEKQDIMIDHDVPPGQSLSETVVVHPKKDFYFDRDLNVALQSERISGVTASTTFKKTKEFESRF